MPLVLNVSEMLLLLLLIAETKWNDLLASLLLVQDLLLAFVCIGTMK